MQVESAQGRAEQYRVTARASAEVIPAGGGEAQKIPEAAGSATYYELGAGAESRAARARAESDALSQLAEILFFSLSASE